MVERNVHPPGLRVKLAVDIFDPWLKVGVGGYLLPGEPGVLRVTTALLGVDAAASVQQANVTGNLAVDLTGDVGKAIPLQDTTYEED